MSTYSRAALRITSICAPLLATACAAVTHNEPEDLPRAHPSADAKEVRITSFDSTGRIALDDGRKFRLAGIHVRPQSETADPDGLRRAAAVIAYSGKAARLDICADGTSAILYYRQPVEDDNPIHAKFPTLTWAAANELLIALGLAFHDPSDPLVEALLARRLSAAQGDYAEAVYRGYPMIYKVPFEERPRVLFRSLHHRFRARITPGDMSGKGSRYWREMSLSHGAASQASSRSTKGR
jgi:hypothetical protein